MSREQAMKAANLIANDFTVGFFATQSLAGLLASGDYDSFTKNALAKDSYVIADAMLKTREM